MPATFRHRNDAQQTCSHCTLAHLCLAGGLDARDIRRLETRVTVGEPIGPGSALFTQGDELTAIYAVGFGAIKSTVVDSDGLEQIMGFHYPGDLLGLDGLGDQLHHCTATALENSQVCRISLECIEPLLDELPGLRHQFMRLMSQALTDDQKLLLTLGRKDSEGRIASLLVNLSRHRRRRGLSASPIRLSMKRAELANFLGMRIETTSRILRRLQTRGIITVDRASVAVLNFPALEACAARGGWTADR